ncbi:MAG: CYTH and CHAD domain-containing protein [Gordonia sp. (in: high G+C Gram-positive bacteria)]
MSPQESLEVELKFDVESGAPTPDLAPLVPGGRAGSPITYRLEAVYFDTADHRLAAQRITLRRRTGGTDGGWHLKRPGGSATARRELRVDFGEAPADGGVPAEIGDLVVAAVRGRELVEIATLTTTRTVRVLYGDDDQPLAEFCSDRVVAQKHPAPGGSADEPQQWSEWELELTGDGDRDGDAVLLANAKKLIKQAGGRRPESSSKLARAIGSVPCDDEPLRLPKKPTGLDLVRVTLDAHRRRLLLLDPLVREDADDAIHQMRVTARKIRSVLTSFPDVLDDAVAEPVVDELTELGQMLSDARDCEVQAEIESELLDAENGPDELRAALLDGEHARRARAVKSLRFGMSTPRYFALLESLDALVDDPAPGPNAERPAEAVARDGVAHARKRLRKAEKKLDETEPQSADWEEQLHRIRKRAKTLRYVALAAEPLHHKKFHKIATHASRIQTHLGDFQDAVVTRERLQRLAVRGDLSGASMFVLGRIDAQTQAHGRDALERYLRDR